MLYLPVTGLDALAATVRRAIAATPLEPVSDRTFHGHITLARAGRRPLGPAARARLAGIPWRSEFTVDAVDLVASAMSVDGPRYTSLGRVPLGRITSSGHRSRSVPSSRPEPRVDPSARPRRPGEPDVERPEESGPP